MAVSLGLLIYFASLGALPVAQAGAGLFSAPLWVALLAVVFFRQRMSVIGAFAVVKFSLIKTDTCLLAWIADR